MGVCKFFLALLALVTLTAAEAESDLVEIEIEDKTYEYSMTVMPAADNPVVELEKRDLLGVLDLKSFVQDLGRVGKYIRVAYNGIGAAGPELQDLQIQVQRIGFDISKLCDKSAVTIASFKTTTRTVLSELKSAYEFLQNSREDMALFTFSTLAELAGKMAKAAENLQKEFEYQETRVTDTLEETMTRGAEQHIRVKEIRAQQEKAKVDMKIQEDLAKEHAKLEADFRAERQRYERKEDKAMSAKSGILGRLGNVFTSFIGLGNLFDDSGDRAMKANRWRQKSIEKLENEKEQRKFKQDALKLMAELVHDIKAMEGRKELADIAAKALHKASRSMKQLIHLLRQATLFWNQLKEHCSRLADDNLQSKIQMFVDRSSEEERREYWRSNNFKKSMYVYISKWVALHSVSSTYLEQIKLTQQDLYNYILEHPTYEESRKNLQALVEDFEKDLKSAHEQIAEENFKANREIEHLKSEVKKENKAEQNKAEQKEEL